MSQHTYPRSSLATAYFKAGFGLLVSGGALFFLNLSEGLLIVFGILFLMFMVFSIKVVLRSTTIVRLSQEGMHVTGTLRAPRFLRWEDAEGLKISYFSTRRDRENGWMQLRFYVRGRHITIDSSISQFDTIAEYAAAAVKEKNIAMDSFTRTNLEALGIASGSALIS